MKEIRHMFQSVFSFNKPLVEKKPKNIWLALRICNFWYTPKGGVCIF